MMCLFGDVRLLEVKSSLFFSSNDRVADIDYQSDIETVDSHISGPLRDRTKPLKFNRFRQSFSHLRASGCRHSIT